MSIANPTFARTCGIFLFQQINSRNGNYKSQSIMKCIVINVNSVIICICSITNQDFILSYFYFLFYIYKFSKFTCMIVSSNRRIMRLKLFLITVK